MLSLHRILIVDDEGLIRKSLSGLLRYYGYEVVAAGSGSECLQIMSSQYFDLVILDIVMPEMSGIEVLQEIKEKYKDTEVIMITGYADKEKAITTFRLGAYDFIEKPFESSEILNTISHCLNQLELRKEIERKNRKLKKSEEQYHSIFNEARDGIVLIDKETGYLFNCNPEFERQTGRRLEELKDMKIWELKSSERVADEKKFFEIRERKANDSGELEFQRPDGKIVPIEFVNKVVEIRGKQFIQSITRDVTRRKEAEAAKRLERDKFEGILAAIGDGVDIVTYDYRVVYTNENLKKIMGKSDPEGHLCYEVFLNRTIPCESCPMRKAIEDGRTVTREVTIPIGKIIESSSSPLRLPTGEMAAIQIIKDITEKIRVEKEAKLIQARLIHVNKMTSLGTLASGIAHEINNPNNFIMFNAPLISEAWQDAIQILTEYHRGNGDFSIGGLPFSEMREVMPKLLSGITEGSRRIKNIVDNLKDFARQDTAILNGILDINKVITASVSMLNSQIRKYTEKFHIDCKKNLPAVKGNAQQLEQVVINLIMNSLQALPDKKCGIWVSTDFDKEPGSVIIKVRDEGIGMSREVLNRITEPFFTTKLDTGGTGLGLPISDSIIKEHQGSLEFESEPGKGTTATIKLQAD